MGNIKEQRIEGDTVKLKIELTEEEALALKGQCKNIVVFSESCDLTESKVLEKGAHKSAKYFKVPFELRILKKKNKSEEGKCYKVETPSKLFLVYTLEKDILENIEPKSK